MLISGILKKYFADVHAEMVNEKEFQYFGLTASKLDAPYCIFMDNEKFIDEIRENVSMVLTTPYLKEKLIGKPYGLCIVEKPRELFFEMHNILSRSLEDGYVRREFLTEIGENCNISPMASVATKNVIIGKNVSIEEFAVIRENTVIGDNSIIRAGAKIGGQGFEFKRSKGVIMPVEHAGGVIIGNDVEIQYNTCVDRGVYPWDNTEIGSFSKVDNLVHIAHGVKIGNNVMVVANSGIGGRTEINDDTWIGFGATLINGITVGRNARANMGSVVTKSIRDNESVTGNFAIEHHKFIDNLKKMM